MPTPCEALRQTQPLDSIGAVQNLDGTSALLGPRTLIYSCAPACQRQRFDPRVAALSPVQQHRRRHPPLHRPPATAALGAVRISALAGHKVSAFLLRRPHGAQSVRISDFSSAADLSSALLCSGCIPGFLHHGLLPRVYRGEPAVCESEDAVEV